MSDHEINDGLLTFDIFRTVDNSSHTVVVDILMASLVIQEVSQLHLNDLKNGTPTLKFFIDMRNELVKQRVIPDWVSVFAAGEIFTKVSEAGESLKKNQLWLAMYQPPTDSTPQS